MAALSSPRMTSYRTIQRDKRPVAANVKPYKGGRVAIDADGFYCPATGASTEVVLPAIFYESVDNTGGADGAKQVEVYWFQEFVVLLQDNDAGAAVVVADRGRPCFQLNDQTVTGDDTKAFSGDVYDVTSEGVWVQVATGPRGAPGA